ncbi:MAG: hypothetical protein KME13_12105 [Myxacorys californica WJT36-NPBG1]|jgi:hypothetical protein|nr:hypothetical protein [Myxacorys californica WJT36-NPBG1]
MDSVSDLQSNVEVIHQKLEELHTLLSALEEQTKLGHLSVPLKMETVEIAMPEKRSPILEDGSFLTD